MEQFPNSLLTNSFLAVFNEESRNSLQKTVFKQFAKEKLWKSFQNEQFPNSLEKARSQPVCQQTNSEQFATEPFQELGNEQRPNSLQKEKFPNTSETSIFQTLKNDELVGK